MTRLCGPGREIALDPDDALRDVRPDRLGHRPAMGQGARGEIDRRDLPSMRGEPKRVSSVSAACVEGAPGVKVHNFADEMCVRWALRDFIRVLTQGLRPEPFPEGVIVGWLGH